MTFALVRPLKSGRCGTDITAQEKFKKLKNGEYNRHVYYNCTRRKNPNCKEKYINQTNLCILLQEFIEQNHKKVKISNKLRAKVEKHSYMTKSFMEHYDVKKDLDKPFVEYSRYVLSNGTEGEKLALSNGIETKLKIKNGVIKWAN